MSSTAQIDRFSIHIHNDISGTRQAGPATETMSASSTTPTFHRVLPYFDRATTSVNLRLGLKCTHPAGGYLIYDADGPHQEEACWVETFDLDGGRKAGDYIYVTRPLKAAPVATGVDAPIACEFVVRERWSKRRQRWETRPGDDDHTGECTLRFELVP